MASRPGRRHAARDDESARLRQGEASSKENEQGKFEHQRMSTETMLEKMPSTVKTRFATPVPLRAEVRLIFT